MPDGAFRGPALDIAPRGQSGGRIANIKQREVIRGGE
jgi:hypothetical protein